MSQDYHQSIFSFSNGFDRSQQQQQEQEQHQNHIAQQIRRDKMRLQQSFHHINPPPPLVAIEEEVVESNGLPSFETAGMLSEMFNFTSGPSTTTATGGVGGDMSYPITTDWYGGGGGGGLGPLDDESSKDPNVVNDGDSIAATHHHHHQPQHQHHHHQQHQHQQHQQQISGINATDSAVAMQLFLMNPHEPKSPTPSPSSSTLHMLLPNPSSGFHHPSTTGGGHFGPSQFTWLQDNNNNNTTSNNTTPHVLENQRLSLSLSSSLQNLEVGKAHEEMLFFNQGGGVGGGEGSSTSTQYHPYKNFVVNNQVGFGGSSLGIVNGLRNSKYSKAAQELLDEFCSIGRGQLKRNNKQLVKQETNPNGGGSSSGGGGGNSSSISKDPPPLSAADRLEHQRRKVKLLSMLDEVDKRYNHYCEQMQMVVNSFDLMMGFGAAIPYTALAQKAMSRHFRCLKDAIAAQLKNSCELLGEKDAGTSGVTKGETPRLRMLEQSLRQQRAFHQMGMMEQEAWRPQRGLPERSVNILRAWLFEHFLHPYPSDADKHLLSRQTGLSRNQVSNWFINARVRLWKPMVEEMYQQESKDEEQVMNEINPNNNNINAQTSRQTLSSPPEITTPNIKRSEFNDTENDPSLIAINTTQHHPITTTTKSSFAAAVSASASASFIPAVHHDSDFGAENSGSNELASPLIRFGTSTGDVSLTLGLRHAGNLPEKGNFSVRDFGGC